jgi:imidazole glycerol-phosphate synthase subunit HisH
VIAVCDYGIGNLRSAEKALVAVGADARLVTRASDAAGAHGVVLPGVGAFASGARALRASGLESVVRSAVATGVPLLGVCVGYQLLFDESEENPGVPGLGIVPGRVARLTGKVKLPQMQWNTVEVAPTSTMFTGLPPRPWFYFVHSYAPVPAPEASEMISGTAEFGDRFVAAIESDHLWGVQFHPEKSGRDGLGLLRRFVETAEAGARVLEVVG